MMCFCLDIVVVSCFSPYQVWTLNSSNIGLLRSPSPNSTAWKVSEVKLLYIRRISSHHPATVDGSSRHLSFIYQQNRRVGQPDCPANRIKQTFHCRTASCINCWMDMNKSCCGCIVNTIQDCGDPWSRLISSDLQQRRFMLQRVPCLAICGSS